MTEYQSKKIIKEIEIGERNISYINPSDISKHQTPNTFISLSYIDDFIVLIRLYNIPTCGSYESMSNDIARLSNNQYFFISNLFEYFKNTIYYVFTCMDEAPILDKIIYDMTYLRKKYNININNINFSGPDFYANRYISEYSKSHNTDNFNYFLIWGMINHVGIDNLNFINNINNKLYKKFKSTLLIFREDNSRYEFVYKLYKIGYYTSDNLYTIFLPAPNKNYTLGNFKRYIKNKYGIWDNKIVNEANLGKSYFGESVMDDKKMLNVPCNNDSYLWISIESTPTIHDTFFITEKSLKSYLWKQPMIIYAVPYYIKTLKELGFIDVFELMGFSSEYDNIENDNVRMEMVVSEIKKFNNLSLEQIHEIYNSEIVQTALDKNFKLIKQLIVPINLDNPRNHLILKQQKNMITSILTNTYDKINNINILIQ